MMLLYQVYFRPSTLAKQLCSILIRPDILVVYGLRMAGIAFLGAFLCTHYDSSLIHR